MHDCGWCLNSLSRKVREGDGATRDHESRLGRGTRKRPLRSLHEKSGCRRSSLREGRASSRPQWEDWRDKSLNRPSSPSSPLSHSPFNYSTFQLFNFPFVSGRRPVSCPAKRGFVSDGSGGDAAHRKGMGWRRPCSHGAAQSLAREAAMAARRNGGFRGRAQAPSVALCLCVR